MMFCPEYFTKKTALAVGEHVCVRSEFVVDLELTVKGISGMGSCNY